MATRGNARPLSAGLRYGAGSVVNSTVDLATAGQWRQRGAFADFAPNGTLREAAFRLNNSPRSTDVGLYIDCKLVYNSDRWHSFRWLLYTVSQKRH